MPSGSGGEPKKRRHEKNFKDEEDNEEMFTDEERIGYLVTDKEEKLARGRNVVFV